MSLINAEEVCIQSLDVENVCQEVTLANEEEFCNHSHQKASFDNDLETSERVKAWPEKRVTDDEKMHVQLLGTKQEVVYSQQRQKHIDSKALNDEEISFKCIDTDLDNEGLSLEETCAETIDIENDNCLFEANDYHDEYINVEDNKNEEVIFRQDDSFEQYFYDEIETFVKRSSKTSKYKNEACIQFIADDDEIDVIHEVDKPCIQTVGVECDTFESIEEDVGDALSLPLNVQHGVSTLAISNKGNINSQEIDDENSQESTCDNESEFLDISYHKEEGIGGNSFKEEPDMWASRSQVIDYSRQPANNTVISNGEEKETMTLRNKNGSNKGCRLETDTGQRIKRTYNQEDLCIVESAENMQVTSSYHSGFSTLPKFWHKADKSIPVDESVHRRSFKSMNDISRKKMIRENTNDVFGTKKVAIRRSEDQNSTKTFGQAVLGFKKHSINKSFRGDEVNTHITPPPYYSHMRRFETERKAMTRTQRTSLKSTIGYSKRRINVRDEDTKETAWMPRTLEGAAEKRGIFYQHSLEMNHTPVNRKQKVFFADDRIEVKTFNMDQHVTFLSKVI